jgi:isocitrate dehydrogenase kinase/phosphatase
MNFLSDQHSTAEGIAQALVDGFDKHYRLFRETTARAKGLFEAGEWLAVQKAVRERIQFYTDRVDECVDRLRNEFRADSLEAATWQSAKLMFIGKLIGHKQPELAETFFNSVTVKILHHAYFHNDFLFMRPAISTEYLESDPPSYRSYYPNQSNLRETVRRILLDFDWKCPFADLERDLEWVLTAVRRHLGGTWPEAEANFQIQVLHSAFYRNKAAYIIGKVVNGTLEYPFALPVLHDENGRLYVDTILLDVTGIAILFSLSRAYFLVDMDVPSTYVQFLHSIMPNKPRSELYTMLGLAKQGKSLFARDLIAHLRHSNDDFIIAPGIRGLVMLVFTLPSFPYVFKIIKDVFGSSKEVDRDTVLAKYVLVKHHDRVGRMADTLDFANVVLPKARFSAELMDELRRLAASSIEEDENTLVFRHIYIERRMIPLNIYLEAAQGEELERVVRDYGSAIREMAAVNIFPGDMLWKNFGVTRYGRVVFYDYDEIEYMTDCNFRWIPEAPYPEMELSAEPWYTVSRSDVFPEEFATFILYNPLVRAAFRKYHTDLLNPKFWQDTQAKIRAGQIVDFFPYSEDVRFCNLFGQAGEGGG